MSLQNTGATPVQGLTVAIDQVSQTTHQLVRVRTDCPLVKKAPNDEQVIAVGILAGHGVRACDIEAPVTKGEGSDVSTFKVTVVQSGHPDVWYVAWIDTLFGGK